MANMDTTLKRSAALRFLAVGTAAILYPQAATSAGERMVGLWAYSYAAPLASQPITVSWIGTVRGTADYTGTVRSAVSMNGLVSAAVAWAGKVT